MCRFVAYLGRPITVDELLLKPTNSLVNQSYDAEEMSQTLNGDGFGLGWYVHHISQKPGLFRSISPAWNNNELFLWVKGQTDSEHVFALLMQHFVKLRGSASSISTQQIKQAVLIVSEKLNRCEEDWTAIPPPITSSALKTTWK
jgi:predicted glutamine amidotransferase